MAQAMGDDKDNKDNKDNKDSKKNGSGGVLTATTATATAVAPLANGKESELDVIWSHSVKAKAHPCHRDNVILGTFSSFGINDIGEDPVAEWCLDVSDSRGYATYLYITSEDGKTRLSMMNRKPTANERHLLNVAAAVVQSVYDCIPGGVVETTQHNRLSSTLHNENQLVIGEEVKSVLYYRFVLRNGGDPLQECIKGVPIYISERPTEELYDDVDFGWTRDRKLEMNQVCATLLRLAEMQLDLYHMVDFVRHERMKVKE